MSDEPMANTDRELFREREDHYAPSVHVTVDGRIGMNVGGTVYVRSIAAWHAAMEKSLGPPVAARKQRGW